ncbi:MAG TPA: glycosyltransferase [Bacteroidales bacterium]|nr:glycosyltransferase [Bacteroidales bacterium]HSA43250.1 glycosyltransferase [Bacteroidales bacterium]
MTTQPSMIMIGSAWPLRGGLSNFNERLVREFISKGYKCSIHTFSLQYPSFLFPGKTQYSTEPAPDGLDIHISLNSVNPLNWILTGLKIKRMKPELVVIKFWIPFMAPCLGTVARIIRRNRHTKVISIIDNIIPHEKRPGDRMLARYWVGSADGFVAMSKTVLEQLNSFDRLKPKAYCPHPIYDNFGKAVTKEEARKLLGLDPTGKYLLFFGFIRDYKGLDLLLKAMAAPDMKALRVKLIVAGEFYTDPQPYHDLIASLNLKDQVILNTDFIPDTEVYKHFCAADLVVQPYKNATQSGVTQIAYHFDKPMIITNVGGLAEFVPDGKAGYVVEPEPYSITDAVCKYFNLNMEAHFIENIKTEKEKYSWARMVDTIIETSS